MPTSPAERRLIVLLRLALAWVFLYAASHQVFVKGWSVAGFLDSTKTFHWLYGPMAHSSLVPAITFLVEYGHLLIGLSLLFGLAVRVSSFFAILLMLTYWTAHMDWPYIEDTTNFLLDFHIVYALLLALLVVKRAGHVFGLDGWAARQDFVTRVGALRWTVA